MTPDQIAQLDDAGQELIARLERLADAVDQARELAEDVRTQIREHNRSVSALRRSDRSYDEVGGVLNSVSASVARAQSLASAVNDFENNAQAFEDAVRNFRQLHPSVVTALSERLAAVSAPVEPTTPEVSP